MRAISEICGRKRAGALTEVQWHTYGAEMRVSQLVDPDVSNLRPCGNESRVSLYFGSVYDISYDIQIMFKRWIAKCGIT